MVASATRSSWRRSAGLFGPEERLAELVDDTRPAELGERIVGRARRDDRAVGQGRPGPVVVGHDHLEPERLRLGDLLDGRDPAVDGEDEPDALLGEPTERVARHAVALLEAAREVPHDVRAELAKEQHREGRRADAVDVVVPVDADARPSLDRCADAGDGDVHVAEEVRVVARQLGGEEAARGLGLPVAAPHEHRCSDVAQRQRLRQRVRRVGVDRVESPDTRHAVDGTDEVGRPLALGRVLSGRAQEPSRRRRSESSTTFTQRRTMATVAPRTMTAMGV